MIRPTRCVGDLSCLAAILKCDLVVYFICFPINTIPSGAEQDTVAASTDNHKGLDDEHNATFDRAFAFRHAAAPAAQLSLHGPAYSLQPDEQLAWWLYIYHL